MGPTDAVEERHLGLSDIEAALVLSNEARWNQTAADWALFIENGSCIGLFAGDRLVATAAALPFGAAFGWISMVLVTADWRRRGLASRLMNQCIKALRAQGCAALLDATPEGAMVYRQLGFKSHCGMARWRGTGAGEPGQAPADAAQLTPLLDVDARVFGADRGFLLRSFAARKDSAIIADGSNFVLLRVGRRATQIGPLIADTPEAACSLLERAIVSISGPVILDVLDAGAALHPVLEAHGFEAFRTFERMVLGRSGLPGIPASLMVAAGPEFG